MPSLGPYEERILGFLLAVGGAVAAAVLGVWLLRVARREFAVALAKKSYSETTVRASSLALEWFGWIVIALIVLRIAGVNLAFGTGGFSGLFMILAVALVAGWNVVTSAVCGLLLVNTQSFQIGDDVEILEPSGMQGPLGRVVSFNYVYTTLQQIDPSHGRPVEVQVPNNQFFLRAWRMEAGARREKLKVGKT